MQGALQTPSDNGQRNEFEMLVSGLKNEGLLDSPEKREGLSEEETKVVRNAIKDLMTSDPLGRENVTADSNQEKGEEIKESKKAEEELTPPEWNEGEADSSIQLIHGIPKGVMEEGVTTINKTLKIPTSKEVNEGASKELSLDRQTTHNVEEIKNKFPLNAEVNVHSNRRAPSDEDITRGIIIDHQKGESGEVYLTISRIVTENGQTGIKTSEFPASGILRLNKNISDVKKNAITEASNNELYRWAKEKAA